MVRKMVKPDTVVNPDEDSAEFQAALQRREREAAIPLLYTMGAMSSEKVRANWPAKMSPSVLTPSGRRTYRKPEPAAALLHHRPAELGLGYNPVHSAEAGVPQCGRLESASVKVALLGNCQSTM